jgi:motility quorum-sensing regulator / GCU-specific mRNA interferase toxin
MEKKKPHRSLSEVKVLVESGRVRATVSAYNTAKMIGINKLAEMCDVVMSLTPANFCKSMTTYKDHTVWQDVYHAKTATGFEVYLKLTVVDDLLIVSFKEL